MDGPRVFCCMPTYGNCHPMASLSYHRYGGRTARSEGIANGSLLTRCFNMAWATALDHHRQGKADYFLMHHADIEVATHRYVEKMLEVMKSLGTAALSVVVPIKSNEGDTSTAVDYDVAPGKGVNVWGPRRLTLAECHHLGPTFSLREILLNHELYRPVNTPRCLLVNTGLLLIDLSRPEWLAIREEDGGLYFKFTMLDRVIEGPDGKFRVGCQSEDWVFSRRMAKHGIPYHATTAISCIHHGDQGWSNQMDAIPQEEKFDVEV